MMLKVFMFSLFSFSCLANDIIGRWKTIDDVTKEEKSLVEISKSSEGLYSGVVVKILKETIESQTLKCSSCAGELKDKPVLGLRIIENIKKEGDEFSGGTILDPKNGKIYKCKIKRIGNKLIVRGYIGFSLLGRSQEWLLDQ